MTKVIEVAYKVAKLATHISAYSGVQVNRHEVTESQTFPLDLYEPVERWGGLDIVDRKTGDVHASFKAFERWWIREGA